MKTIITTIINGKVLNQESLSFNTKAEYDNYINGMIDYIADKELEVKLNHEAFKEKAIDFLGDPVSVFFSKSFSSVAMVKSIAWQENGVITICSTEDDTVNIGSSDETKTMC